MTPKEKAEQLFQVYLPYVESSNYKEEIIHRCKQCSLIAVNEIRAIAVQLTNFELAVFWSEVKKEIENL